MVYVHRRDKETKSSRSEDDIEGQPVTGKKADLVHGSLVSFSSVSQLFLDQK